MSQLLLFIVVALVVGTIVFGVTVLLSGGDSGLTPVEPDGQSVPLPGDRPLGEDDISRTRFDTAWRGYRMSQVDQALQRAAYDIGYKGELIGVLEAEVTALREGRLEDADGLRAAREAAVAPAVAAAAESAPEPVAPDQAPVAPDKDVDEKDPEGPAVEVAAVPPVTPPAADEEPAESR
ncbi:DivIVA domain-containing protein [Actinoplanes awajinensis]|uniref:DivIVA domain-containing protein n=1 Tax=Actinoplanes awajinensis TaxID=135946 RepID=UPI000A7045F1|nr:DivIVA domain-containing protein [Actinoplanes awajinensis]